MAAALVLYVGLRLLRSDETRIRDMLSAMVDGFNEGSPSRAISGMDENYVEETTKATRDEVKQLLIWLYLTTRDDTTGEFRLRIAVSDLNVKVDPDHRKAALSFQVQFFEHRTQSLQPIWRVAVEAALEKKGSWNLASSRHRSIQGKRPF